MVYGIPCSFVYMIVLLRSVTHAQSFRLGVVFCPNPYFILCRPSSRTRVGHENATKTLYNPVDIRPVSAVIDVIPNLRFTETTRAGPSGSTDP